MSNVDYNKLAVAILDWWKADVARDGYDGSGYESGLLVARGAHTTADAEIGVGEALYGRLAMAWNDAIGWAVDEALLEDEALTTALWVELEARAAR